MDIPLPTYKLSLGLIDQDNLSDTRIKNRIYVVLVSTGSFNPPTYMHLRMFELARDAVKSEGYCVIGGYLSPVNDAYKKKGLLSAEHRIQMCELACRSSSLIMVDPWEAKQSNYQRTLTVLERIKSFLCEEGLVPRENLKVMLLCGSDLLESFSVPGFWIPEQVRAICRDHGVVCIRREGKDIEKIIAADDILCENKSNIIVVDEMVPNQISSTRVSNVETLYQCDCCTSPKRYLGPINEKKIQQTAQHTLNLTAMGKLCFIVDFTVLQGATSIFFLGETAMNLKTELDWGSKVKCSSYGRREQPWLLCQDSTGGAFMFPCAVNIFECHWDCENFLLLCPVHATQTTI